MKRGIWRCGLAAVLFGISAPAASRLAARLGAFTLAGLLYLGAAVAVLPVVGHRWPSPASIRRGLPRLALAVAVGGAIAPVLLATGLRHAPGATASLLLNLELVFTAAVAHLVFREHIGRRVVAGTAFVVFASVILGWSGGASVRWGAALIAGACLCWAIDNCVTASLDELAPAHITLAKGIVAGSVNVAIGLAAHGFPAGWPMLAALVVGGCGYGVSITLWIAGARELGAARAQLVFAAAPFVGALVAWTVFGERVLGRQVVSLALAAVGVSFVLGSGHEHAHRHVAVEHDHEHAHDDGHHHHQHGEHEQLLDSGVRHQHPHRHEVVVHAHPHVPDIHHRHEHSDV
jgi:drug/metabolite transporter (DMT)-like permease